MARDGYRHGPATAITAGDIMTSPVITVAVGSTRAQIADLLTGHRISAAPVLDASGVVVGLVSEHDLLAKPGESAADLMTTSVISVSPDCPLAELRHLLVERRIRRVPVMREGKLAGIVSRGDVVATMVTEWVCEVCGEAVHGEHRPDVCPRCQTGGHRFVLQEQPPGA